MTGIVNRARAEILALEPYKSARSIVQGREGMVYLDANECPYEPMPGVSGYSRYAPQQPKGLVEAICRVYDISSRNLLVTRGADEAIDLTVRAFCEPGKDNIIVCPPTFPMYAHSARVQGAKVIGVPLDQDFQLDVPAVIKAADENTKIIFVCSPNNPTANLLRAEDIVELCRQFEDRALVAVDETYNAFTAEPSFTGEVEKFPNLIVYRTLSKEYACAGIRCGLAVARHDVIELIRRILPPYPVAVPVAQAVEKILSKDNAARLAARRAEILATKDRFLKALRDLPEVEQIYPGEANFVLVRFRDAARIVRECLAHDIVLRDQSYQKGLENCVRISIGSDTEMDRLLSVLKGMPEKQSAAAFRTARLTRNTSETAIDVFVNLDAASPVKISTGIGFYDHMLEQVARHGGFALELNCKGDLEIDPHHTMEDCAIALGQALKQALGGKTGISRYGFLMPMDESLAQVAIDLSGRYTLEFEGNFPDRMVGEMPVEMVEHVFRSLCENLQATCHIGVRGKNTHHMVEACFKGFGRALRQAIARQGEDLPSTKGLL